MADELDRVIQETEDFIKYIESAFALIDSIEHYEKPLDGLMVM
jgi:hypothetical protein